MKRIELRRKLQVLFLTAMTVILATMIPVARFSAVRREHKTTTHHPAPAAHTLAGALNPDGTLKAGVNGSFDTGGYRLEHAATGAPRFVPAAAQTASNGWDTQFSLPDDGMTNSFSETTLKSIAELSAEQGTRPLSFDERLGDFWPADESADDFLAALAGRLEPLTPEELQAEWRELAAYGAQKAAEVGGTSEEDVDRIVNQYRREQRNADFPPTLGE